MRKFVLGDDLNAVKSAYAMQFSNPWVLTTDLDDASEKPIHSGWRKPIDISRDNSK